MDTTETPTQIPARLDFEQHAPDVYGGVSHLDRVATRIGCYADAARRPAGVASLRSSTSTKAWMA